MPPIIIATAKAVISLVIIKSEHIIPMRRASKRRESKITEGSSSEKRKSLIKTEKKS